MSESLNLLNPIGSAQAAEELPEEASRRLQDLAEPVEPEPGDVMRIQRFTAAWESLKQIDPTNDAFRSLKVPGALPTEAEIAQLEGAAREAAIQRTCDFLRPDGKPIDERGTSSDIHVLPGSLVAAQRNYDDLSIGGTSRPMPNGSRVRLLAESGLITLRPATSTLDSLSFGMSRLNAAPFHWSNRL